MPSASANSVPLSQVMLTKIRGNRAPSFRSMPLRARTTLSLVLSLIGTMISRRVLRSVSMSHVRLKPLPLSRLSISQCPKVVRVFTISGRFSMLLPAGLRGTLPSGRSGFRRRLPCCGSISTVRSSPKISARM